MSTLSKIVKVKLRKKVQATTYSTWLNRETYREKNETVSFLLILLNC